MTMMMVTTSRYLLSAANLHSYLRCNNQQNDQAKTRKDLFTEESHKGSNSDHSEWPVPVGLFTRMNVNFSFGSMLRFNMKKCLFMGLECQHKTFATNCIQNIGPLSKCYNKITLLAKGCHRSRLYQGSCRNFNDSADRQPFRHKLQMATYISCGIGVCMLSAIAWKEYSKFTRRVRGAKAIKDREVSGQRVISYNYRGFVIPAFMVDKLDALNQFNVREDDVWIVTFPKAGTTWLQEIVYLICTDFNYDDAQRKIMEDRFPYLEYITPGIQPINKMELPRFIKTHLPPSLLPRQVNEKKPKMIYLARNPKDTIVSYYHFTKSLSIITYFGDLNTFYNQFVHDTMVYGPWWKHVKEGWKMKDEDNVLFLKYEDLHKDLRGCIRQVAAFLGKPLNEEQLEILVRHVSFASMKNNNSTNYSWMKGWAVREGEENKFMRKGRVGDWKNHLNSEMSDTIDEIMRDKLQGTGLTFEDMPPSNS